LQNLEELNISGVSATAANVVSFVNHHKSTLVFLGVKDVSLAEGVWEPVLEYLRQKEAV
jgi:hypothetical protein